MPENKGSEVTYSTPDGDPTKERHDDADNDVAEFLNQEDTKDSSDIVNEEASEEREEAEVVVDTPETEIEDKEEPEQKQEETKDDSTADEEEKEEKEQEEAPVEDFDVPDSLTQDRTGYKESAEEKPSPEEDTSGVEALRTELNRISAQLLSERNERKVTEDKQKRAELHLEDKTYLEGDDIHDYLSDSEKFNALLNRVRKEAIVEARELFMTEVPDLVMPTIRKVQEQQTKARKFFATNKDLLPAAETVKLVAQDLLDEGMTEEEMIVKLAPETRRRMGNDPNKPISNAVRTKTKAQSEKPAFTGAGNTRKPTQKQVSEMGSAFDDMLANEQPDT